MKAELTAERLREVLDYNHETGEFRWRNSRGRVARGAHAGCMRMGYMQIGIDAVPYLSHRLAWMYVHGEWPSQQIDHINGVRSDNRIANLREATPSENQQNRSARCETTSGLVGASWNSKRGKWQSAITLNGKRKELGAFETKEDAHAAYLEAKKAMHSFSPEPRKMNRIHKHERRSVI